MEVPYTKTNCHYQQAHHSYFWTDAYHLSFSYLQFAAAWSLSRTKHMPGAPELLISNSTATSVLVNENAIWKFWSDDIIQNETVKLVMDDADELLDRT